MRNRRAVAVKPTQRKRLACGGTPELGSVSEHLAELATTPTISGKNKLMHHWLLRHWLLRHWLTGKFEDRATERAYQSWHLRLWTPRFRVLLLVTNCVYMGGALSSLCDNLSFANQLIIVHPELKFLVVITTLLARVCGLFGLALNHNNRFVQAESYQRHMFMLLIMPSVVEALPSLWLIASWHWSAQLGLTEEMSAIASASWSRDPVHAARACYWHATLTDFFCTVIGGLSGLTPTACLLLGLVAIALQHTTLVVAWTATSSLRAQSAFLSGETLVPLFFRFVPLLAMFLISLSQEHTQREEFRFKYLLQQLREERVEQLQREKERLDWESKLVPPRRRGPLSSSNPDSLSTYGTDAELVQAFRAHAEPVRAISEYASSCGTGDQRRAPGGGWGFSVQQGAAAAGGKLP